MSPANEELIQTVKGIRREVSQLHAEDPDAIVQVGAALEQLVSQIPADMPLLRDLLFRCLAILQTLYEHATNQREGDAASADPPQLIQALTRALVATEQYLCAPGNPIVETMVQEAAAALPASEGDVPSASDEVPSAEATKETADSSADEAADTNTDEIIREFLIESAENLDQLDRDFVTLEEDPTNRECLTRIFRTIHTIKGTCGFLGFTKLEHLTHVGENLLSRLRDGELMLTPEITSALLAMVDAVRRMLSSIESERHEGDGDDSALIATLTRLAEIPVSMGRITPEDVQAVLREKEQGRLGYSGAILIEKDLATPKDVAEALRIQESESRPVGATNQAASTTVTDTTVRVDVGLLDRLMNLVGELVLARNQILQLAGAQEDPAFLATSQRLNLITTELQEGVMKTRMQPIGSLWNKLPRVVRDLALACGKKVRVEMEGEETELDRTLLEAIKDPLTHLVRNAVDHGIEPPEQRVACGKPEVGRLLLRAYHEGGQVNVEIADDGAGIDLERVKRKAIERGLITPEQAARLSEREAAHLIFLPGFSTAETVTNVSGRGVGMDVVKTNIERIGGMVDVQSQLGQGTTIRLKIPLTLAITPALIVTSGMERYAIPQTSLLEVVRLEGGQARRGIETIQGVPVYRLRGNLIPLVYLNQMLGVGSFTDTVRSQSQASRVDFEAVRAKHLLWKVRLRRFLDGEEALTEAQVVSHRDCDLGKWLYGEGLAAFGSLPEMIQLERIHAELHSTVRQVVQLERAGNRAAAEQMLTQVEMISSQIIALLNIIEHRVAGAQTVNIIVLQADDRPFGLVVDEVVDTAEIVVKPLGKQLKSIPVYAGATIMGDGKVALILDVLGIAQQTGVVSESREQAFKTEEVASTDHAEERQTLLLARVGQEGQVAIPLAMVSRLEELPLAQIERMGYQEVVQYRGRIMPLLRLSDALRLDALPSDAEKIKVVVYAENGGSVGLVVDDILDIVEEPVAALQRTPRHGVIGSAVIQQRVTDLLDVPSLIRAADLLGEN